MRDLDLCAPLDIIKCILIKNQNKEKKRLPIYRVTARQITKRHIKSSIKNVHYIIAAIIVSDIIT